MIIVDGIQYEDASLAPDLGSWKCTHVESGFTVLEDFIKVNQ